MRELWSMWMLRTFRVVDWVLGVVLLVSVAISIKEQLADPTQVSPSTAAILITTALCLGVWSIVEAIRSGRELARRKAEGDDEED